MVGASTIRGDIVRPKQCGSVVDTTKWEYANMSAIVIYIYGKEALTSEAFG